jgi:hypothetical protein
MKSRKQIIYDACEMLETGKREFSCTAISYQWCSIKPSPYALNICRKYISFYDKHDCFSWGFSDEESKKGVQERILALLLFAEVEL